MIREAVVEDIPRLLEMGEAFWSGSPWAASGPFSPAKAGPAFERFIASESVGLFVIDKDGVCGALAIIVSDLWPVEGGVLAQEAFWWVERRGSGEALALWERGERFAKDNGAQALAMIRLEGMRDDAVDLLYRRRGYRVKEHLYTRPL